MKPHTKTRAAVTKAQRQKRRDAAEATWFRGYKVGFDEASARLEMLAKAISACGVGAATKQIVESARAFQRFVRARR